MTTTDYVPTTAFRFLYIIKEEFFKKYTEEERSEHKLIE